MVYCWKCGTELREDAAFCSRCGASVRGTMGVQSPTGFELLGHDKSVQNHWARRLIAFVIDAIIVSVALTIIAVAVSLPFLITLSFSSTVVGAFPGWWGLWLGGLIPLFVFLYFFLAEGLYSRTIGKEIMGLRVERVDGKPMDLRSSFVRNVSKIYWLLLLLDVAVGLGTHGETSQKWSDRYVGTKVEEKTRMIVIP